MIYLSHSVPVNGPGTPVVTGGRLWDGLVAKANNALPFVAVMSHCEVLERHSATAFDREVEVRGDRVIERVRLEHPHRVVFTRLSGPVLGVIANEIEGVDGEPAALGLRFSFALVVRGLEGGSDAERAHAEQMRDDYESAVRSTLDAVRQIEAAR